MLQSILTEFAFLLSLHKRNGINFNFSPKEAMRYFPSIARDTSTIKI